GLGAPPRRLAGSEQCEASVDVVVNQVFFRREPHMMRRYLALAADNIRADPVSFVMASAYRAGRLFIIQGDADRFTAHQFSRSMIIYALGTAASAAVLCACLAGIAIAWRRGNRVGLPVLLIASLPATLAPVLVNMRYTVTVQPLMLIFVAVALLTI